VGDRMKMEVVLETWKSLMKISYMSLTKWDEISRDFELFWIWNTVEMLVFSMEFIWEQRVWDMKRTNIEQPKIARA
jgi:hypothetical protein